MCASACISSPRTVVIPKMSYFKPGNLKDRKLFKVDMQQMSFRVQKDVSREVTRGSIFIHITTIPLQDGFQLTHFACRAQNFRRRK